MNELPSASFVAQKMVEAKNDICAEALQKIINAEKSRCVEVLSKAYLKYESLEKELGFLNRR